MTIYLDRYQCETFELPYFGAAETMLRADLILSSKLQGYDSHHRNILEPLLQELVSLSRMEADPPGWYCIINS